MKVAFLNENILGHKSYLPPFVAELLRRPELGIEPRLIDVLPLPRSLRWWGDTSVPLLRRWGFDLWFMRWRLAASRHATQQLKAAHRLEPVDAVVANTQSIALGLADRSLRLPYFVSLDATFAMLGQTRWFAPNPTARALLSASLLPIRLRERALYRRAAGVLPWSGHIEPSLRDDYGVSPQKIHVLPPSIEPPARRSQRRSSGRRQILFIGGDFVRKGGPLVLECWRRHFADRCDLHVVTQSPVAAEAGMQVHSGVVAGGDAWRQRWEEADVFVFPSAMETFGIVLIEALAFMVPAVASTAGAATDILDEGRAGWLLREVSEAALRSELESAMSLSLECRERVEHGRRRFEERFSLPKNTERLAALLRQAALDRDEFRTPNTAPYR